MNKILLLSFSFFLLHLSGIFQNVGAIIIKSRASVQQPANPGSKEFSLEWLIF